MERLVNTKFYTFSQNNSGGYFVENDQNGVAEYVVIEATSSDEAWDRLQNIGDKVDGMFDYCSCCGERWSDFLVEGTEKPMIYDAPVETVQKSMFREKAFVHYYDGTIKKFVFKPNQ